MSRRRRSCPSLSLTAAAEPMPEAEGHRGWHQLLLGRLLVAFSLLLLLGPVGQAAEFDRLPGGEAVAVTAVDSLPAVSQILPQHPLPPPDAVSSQGCWSCGTEDQEVRVGRAPRRVARPEPWLREWRSVALLR